MEEFENDVPHEDALPTDGLNELLTKDEILERSRKENVHGDEGLKNATMKAGYFAMLAGALLCLSLYLLFGLLKNETRYELFMLYTVMEAVYMGVQFHHIHKKSMLISSIAFAVASVGFAIILIVQFAGIA